MTPYHRYVSDLVSGFERGRSFPMGGFAPLERKEPASDAPRVLIFSPHPDDEVIIGGAALRLMREGGYRVVNVAVTQGSNRDRQAERLEELKRACEYIGFELVQTAPNGLEKINPSGRERETQNWHHAVGVIAGILREHAPRVILFPHDRDWNSSHIGTHLLVVDALKSLGPEFSCFSLETEFWGAMWDPNLMVETSPEELGDLLAALSFHVGEVKRNPYHLLVPAWMQDNVRRGCEVALGQGGAAPDFRFATLYRLRRWQGGGFAPLLKKGRAVSSAEKLSDLLK
ncbi:MAG TPA: PIG-L family deacetylase [Verrucomicrobiales bacterium]|nr:PIG-L family deacetylase [Verrucomicrobiales bacterium]